MLGIGREVKYLGMCRTLQLCLQAMPMAMPTGMWQVGRESTPCSVIPIVPTALRLTVLEDLLTSSPCACQCRADLL
jgi:hypothetical protein